jgi:DHA1 family tetracycline resistance protein-like MFS transporter
VKNRSPLLFIFLTVFIDLLGVGIVLPLLPEYVRIVERSSWPLLVENRALIVGAMTAGFSLMQFLFAPIFGVLGDRFGRRPVLLISLVGSGLSYIVFGLADSLTFLSVEGIIAVLFISRMVAGATGASIATAQAYIADVTAPEERARGLGMLGAAFGLGFMLGPALGGVLSGVSLATPAYVAAGLSLANAAFGFFRLPESLPVEKRSKTIGRSLNPFVRLQAIAGDLRVRPFLLSSILLNLAFAALQTNFAVFSAERFGFGPQQNAAVFAQIGLLAVIVQGFLIRRLVQRFGESRLAPVGMVLMSSGFAAVALVPQAWMVFPAIALLSIGSGIATPSLSSLISRAIPSSEQGRVLGGVQAFTSLTMIIGPLLAGAMFEGIGQSAPYLFGALLLAASLAVLSRGLQRRNVPEKAEATAVPTYSEQVTVGE